LFPALNDGFPVVVRNTLQEKAMSETAEQYNKRFAGYVHGRDPLQMQREAPTTIMTLIKDLSSEELARRPRDNKWSIVEILAHLAEDELTSTWRYRQMIEHDGITLEGFDQDLWAELGRYSAWSASEALQMFRLLREANLRMLASLRPEQWERTGNHSERGKLTVRDLARHMAAHDINHIKQIEELVRSTASGRSTG
jgi:uncharacterized damage-inducible protein DinB